MNLYTMKEKILFYSVILFIVGMSLKIYLESEQFNLKCVISSVDGNKYCVREREDLEKTADLLAKVINKLKTLVETMKKEKPDDPMIERIFINFNPKNITETLPTSVHTAYSENKGEKMAFCLTKKKNGKKLIDENTLTFVAIHELAHTGTETIGHDKKFWGNFKQLLKYAADLDLYKPEDYKGKPKKYCGMEITDNPYFDL